VTNQIEQEEAEAPQREAPSPGQKHQTDAGQLLGQAVQQRVAQTIEPMLGEIQRRMAEIVQQHIKLELRRAPVPGQEQDSQPSGEESSSQVQEGLPPEGAEQPLSFTVTVDRHQAEQALRAALGGVLDSLFSDTLRAAVEQQSKKALQSLAAAGHKALSEEDSHNKVQERMEQTLGRMIDELFSGSMRDQAQRDGDQVIRAVIRGDLPSAQQEGERALQSFAERWASVAREHWEKVVQVLLKAVMDASKEMSTDKTRDTAAPESAEEQQDIPQTIQRSDQRAQDLWKKARDQAIKRNGAGRRAARAGYEALKQEYEKKGGRWVRKDIGGQPHSRTVRERKAGSGPTRESRAAADRGKEANPPPPARQKRSESRRPR
jgi:hypothetical protein